MKPKLYVVFDRHGHHAVCVAGVPEEALRAARKSGKFHKRARLSFVLVPLYTRDAGGNNGAYLDLGLLGANGWIRE